VRSELTAIEDLFVDGSPDVLGDTMSLADIALYHVPWFLGVLEPGHVFLDQMQQTREWMARVAVIGHGERITIAASGAIELANEASPKAIELSDYIAPEGLGIGDAVSVSPLDEVSPAYGVLARVDDRRISITVSNERVNEVCVHFPRSGYKLSRDRRT
jgi:glutathione S-transferase